MTSLQPRLNLERKKDSKELKEMQGTNLKNCMSTGELDLLPSNIIPLQLQIQKNLINERQPVTKKKSNNINERLDQIRK